MPDLDIALKDAMQIDGSIGAALVDYTSGMALGVAGGNRDLDLTVAAAGNTDVIRAKIGAADADRLIDAAIAEVGDKLH